MAFTFSSRTPSPQTPSQLGRPNAPRKHAHISHECDQMVAGVSSMCDKCRDILSVLMATTPDTPDICYLKVTFNVTVETHDGYCSDGYDFQTEKSTLIRVFPVPLSLASKEFVRYFIPSPRGHGNGYCGCKTTYSVESAKWKNMRPHACDSLKDFLSV